MSRILVGTASWGRPESDEVRQVPSAGREECGGAAALLCTEILAAPVAERGLDIARLHLRPRLILSRDPDGFDIEDEVIGRSFAE